MDNFQKYLNTQRNSEKRIYKDSINYLYTHIDGKKYLTLIELIQRVCAETIIQKSIINEDEKTIAYIGARIFNNGNEALRTALGGYYQISLSLIRDIIEIQFLLDYFKSNKSEITKWRSSTNEQRWKFYGPHVLYKKLDERDGYTGEKRKNTYKTFCEYAAHVSYPGIKLTTNDKGEVMIGAFFNEKKLLNTIYELNQRLGHTVMILSSLIPTSNVSLAEYQIELMRKYGEVFNIDLDIYKKRLSNLTNIIGKIKTYGKD